ncbi:MAG: hypothetical protein V4482_00620 [Pseudomonadota bacterium]
MAFPFVAAAMGLAEFAPAIVRWLSGDDAEKVAADVVSSARRITGKDELSELFDELRTDPTVLIQFQKDMLSMETERELAYLKDRQGARDRDVLLAQAGHRNYRADVMVISAAVGMITCLASLAYFKDHLPGEAVGIISTIAGIFGACLKDAYAFEFGSSRGSKEKDSTVASMLSQIR